MEYVEVKFRESDARTYCYHNVGVPLKVGDHVKLPPRGRDADADAWLRGVVVEIHHNKPKFETKPILGLAPSKEET